MTSLIVTNKRSKPRVKILSPKSGNLSFSRSVSLCPTNYHSDHVNDVSDDHMNNDHNILANRSNYNVNNNSNSNNCHNSSNAIKNTKLVSKGDVTYFNTGRGQPLQRHVLAVIDGNRTNANASKSKSNTLNNLFVKQD